MLEDFTLKLQKELELKGSSNGADEGEFAFLLDNTTISISEASQGFQLMANLGELPTELSEIFFGKMLRANLFGQATAGSVLGLDETGTRIMLRYYSPNKATYTDFKEKIEDFINTVDFWKEQVASHQANPKAA